MRSIFCVHPITSPCSSLVRAPDLRVKSASTIMLSCVPRKTLNLLNSNDNVFLMSYTIPTEEQIQHALKKVLHTHSVVQSQRRLHQLVLKELNTASKLYGISPAHLREIVLKSDFVKIEIHTREGDPKKLLTKCPVCHSSLHKVKNKTIWGGKVTIELRCRTCGYWTGKRKQIPTRYVFHLRKK